MGQLTSPPPGLGVIKHGRGRGSSPSATPSLRTPSSPGWGSHTTGSPDAWGSQEIRVGHHPSQHLGHSHHPKGHPLSSPPSPRGNLGPPRCGHPASVALSGRCHSASWFQDSSVFHSSLWPSGLRCVHAPCAAHPRVWQHWVASPFVCSRSGCCEHLGKVSGVDPQFSWSHTRERNCWSLGNTVLSRLTGAASLMSLFT